MGGTDWKGAKFTSLSELVGMDDKGVYVTNVRGKHRIGDPKGGKLSGETVSYRSDAKGGPIGISQIPSYALSQTRGVLPIQIQELLGWVAGETSWFDAITKGAGFYTSTTYPTKKKTEVAFVEEYMRLRKSKSSLGQWYRKIRAYNKRRRAAEDMENLINSSSMSKKANKLLRAERLQLRDDRANQ
jgi:hypothetical protein